MPKQPLRIFQSPKTFKVATPVILIMMLKVDEEGSEAAALTGIVLDIRTARVPQVIKVDR